MLLDGEPVAFVEVTPIGEGSGVDPDAIEIGVVVHPDHWGKGFALEAVDDELHELTPGALLG